MLLKPLPKKYLGVVIIPGIMRQPINWCNLKDKLKPKQWCKKCKNNIEADTITEACFQCRPAYLQHPPSNFRDINEPTPQPPKFWNIFKNLLQIIPTNAQTLPVLWQVFKLAWALHRLKKVIWKDLMQPNLNKPYTPELHIEWRNKHVTTSQSKRKN